MFNAVQGNEDVIDFTRLYVAEGEHGVEITPSGVTTGHQSNFDRAKA